MPLPQCHIPLRLLMETAHKPHGNGGYPDAYSRSESWVGSLLPSEEALWGNGKTARQIRV